MLFRYLKRWSHPLEIIRSWYAISWLIRCQSTFPGPDLRTDHQYHALNEYQQLLRYIRILHASFLIHFKVDPLWPWTDPPLVDLCCARTDILYTPALRWSGIWAFFAVLKYIVLLLSEKDTRLVELIDCTGLMSTRGIFPGWTCEISGVVV